MIKKTIYFWVVITLFSACDSGNFDKNKYLETTAVEVLDDMSVSIGELKSCSFMLQINSETYTDSLGVVSYEAISDVYMRGPDKMYIHTNSNRGMRGYWYNGSQLAWLNYNENVFDTIPAPETILQTINAAHETYGVDFPAADFFYPTFTDDIINQFDSVFYVGSQKVEGENISEILAVNSTMKVNIWIAKSGEQSYPVGFSIVRVENEKELRYMADFSHWLFDPVLPDNLFEFSPPEKTVKKPIQPLKY